MREYIVVWDGSRAINNGYLAAVPEERREPPAREDWSKFFPPQPVKALSLVEKMAALLTEKPYSVRQIQIATHVKMSAIQTALARLRRSGHLRNKKATAAEGVRHWVNYYWLEK